ncbi:maleylpyruvate isomerase family mycothiol-dependent enzyme [Microlunatus sp. GCM10028923]|uniref:maleylpyruvate isomerase family mycothiol-dependent enzyme n=1 Tax=Microlunatus sp. GCM10028923 TaxID=3273400 RepID=UPI003615D953
MDEKDELWAMIDAQREVTATLLDQLTEKEWSRPSLCAGWTVRDVAAHLTLQQVGFGELVGSLIRHPGVLGGMNHMINGIARIKAAAEPTGSLIREIRGMIGSRRHNVGVTAEETLIDIAVHGQDIAVPLDRELDLPPATAARAASRAWSYGARGKAAVFARIPVSGYRLVATDTEWERGDGPEIRGPIAALLLLITGRRAGLTRLVGPGADRLRAATGGPSRLAN